MQKMGKQRRKDSDAPKVRQYACTAVGAKTQNSSAIWAELLLCYPTLSPVQQSKYKLRQLTIKKIPILRQDIYKVNEQECCSLEWVELRMNWMRVFEMNWLTFMSLSAQFWHRWKLETIMCFVMIRTQTQHNSLLWCLLTGNVASFRLNHGKPQ